MADIDSLAIQIDADAGKATSGLEKLASTLERLRKSVSGSASGMSKLAASLGQLTQALSGADFSALDGVADKIRDIAAAVDGLDGTKLANLAKVAQKFNNVAKSAQNAATAAKQAQQAIDGGMAHQGGGTQTGKIQRNGQAARDAGKDAEKGASGFEKFFDRVKRIATTMMIRAAFKAIVAAFKAGITNLYNWSNAVGTDFAPSMDKIATSALYLKNSLGAMVSPLITSFAPVLDWIIDQLVVAINYVNMFFAAISGASTYTAAKKQATSWGDAAKSSAKGAKGAAEDLKRTILGFDEINKLNGDNGGGGSGGGGGGSSGTDVSGMFEERAINSAVAGIADGIRNVLEPIFKWIGENMDNIFTVASTIGALLLTWKISSALITNATALSTTLGTIATIIGSVATAVITVMLTYKLANGYMATGKWGYLVGDGIAGALGAFIVGKMVTRSAGATAGMYAASAVLELAAITNISVALGNIRNNGITKENILVSVLGVIEAAAAGVIIAKAAGLFSGIAGAGLAVVLALGVSLVVDSISITAKEGGISILAFGEAVAGSALVGFVGMKVLKALGVNAMGGLFGFMTISGIALTLAFAVTGITMALSNNRTLDEKLINGAITSALAALGTFIAAAGAGLSLASALALTGGVGLTLFFVIAAISLAKDDSLKSKVNWGSLQLTKDQLKTLAQSYLGVSVTPTITVLNTKISDLNTARTSLNNAAALLSATTMPIRLGVKLTKDVETKIQEQLDDGNGGGVIPSITKTLEESNAAISIGLNLAPAKNAAGEDVSADILSITGLADTSIQDTVTRYGGYITTWLNDGVVAGLEGTKEELISKYIGFINDIAYAVANSETVGKFNYKLDTIASSMTQESFDGLMTELDTALGDYKTGLTSAADTYKEELYIKRAANQAVLDTLIESGADQATIDAQKALIDKIDATISELDVDKTVNDAFNEKLDEVRSILLPQIAAVYGDTFDDMANSTDILKQVSLGKSDLFNTFFQALTTGDTDKAAEKFNGLILDTLINAGLTSADAESLKHAAETLDLPIWSLLSDSLRTKLYQNLLSSDKIDAQMAQELMKSAGYDLTSVLTDSLDSGTATVTQSGNNYVIDFANGVQAELDTTGKTVKEAFEDLGIDMTDGAIEGMSDEMKSKLVELAKIFGYPEDEVKEVLGIHSPSTVFKNIGSMVVKGFIAGLQMLGTSLGGVWTALPDWAQKMINTVVSSFLGVDVDLGVVFSPTDSNNKSYEGTGMWKYLRDIFSAGTSTDVTANLIKGTGTIGGLFGTVLDVLANLFGTKKGSKTISGLFGTVLTVLANLFGINKGSNTIGGLFGTVLSILGNLFGIKSGSNTIGGLFGTVLSVLATLFGIKSGSNTIGGLFGNVLSVFASLFKKDGKDNNPKGVFGDALSVFASLFKKSDSKEPKNFWPNAFDVAANLVKGKKSDGKDMSLEDLYGKSFDVKVNIKPGSSVGLNITQVPKALGGVFQNGAWSGIPQYAGGALNAGSMFIAGEAGPELVGHIGGRTEVLNKSQLAAAMYSAVSAAMAPAAINFAYAAQRMDEDDGADNSAILDLLRQQNDYLRRINDKEFTAEITASDIARGQARMNRRAGTTIIPVATP
mgnify:CR=1 FL=1